MLKRFLGQKAPKCADKIATNAAEIRTLKAQHKRAKEDALIAAREGGHLDALSAAMLQKVAQ